MTIEERVSEIEKAIEEIRKIMSMQVSAEMARTEWEEEITDLIKELTMSVVNLEREDIKEMMS